MAKPGFAPTPPIERIFSNGRVRYDGGCWIWTGFIEDGYGKIHKGRVHRVVYEALVGPIPKGMETDHLCRNRACCNPLHIEIVTRRENILRGVSPQAVNARKDRCPRGHEYSLREKGWRYCVPCTRESGRRTYAQRKLS